MQTIEYDEEEWNGDELKLFRKGKEVDTIFVRDIINEWMKDMEKKGNIKYKEVG
jgi:hypothetical protein